MTNFASEEILGTALSNRCFFATHKHCKLDVAVLYSCVLTKHFNRSTEFMKSFFTEKVLSSRGLNQCPCALDNTLYV